MLAFAALFGEEKDPANEMMLYKGIASSREILHTNAVSIAVRHKMFKKLVTIWSQFLDFMGDFVEKISHYSGEKSL